VRLCPSADENTNHCSPSLERRLAAPQNCNQNEECCSGIKTDMNPHPVNRRDLLRLALGGVAIPAALAALAPRLDAQSGAAATANPEAFTAARVTDLARALAAEAHKPPAPAPLDVFASATPEEMAAIRFKPAELLWVGDGLAFAIEPLHRSRNLPGEAELYTVDGAAATRVAYDPGKFDFGKLKPPPASAQLGFTGFRVHYRGGNGKLHAVASLLNASIVSAIGDKQVWGAISRPLTVRSGEQVAEEAPQIRAVWIEKPKPTATELIVHAVVDTPSLAAAVRFTLRAGEATVIDTECTIFARKQVDHFGLTSIQATYLSGPLDWPLADDMRPAVYEAGGVQMLTGSGEWIWRPITNRARLQISGFVDNDPQGFGLIQRDRAFSAFLDDDNEWQRRPSVWIEPIGKWGQGEVTLLEIPAASQNNKNIACYWRPKAALAAGSEGSFAYRQFWSWRPPGRPDGAIVTASRIGRIPGDTSETRTRFLLQFEGEPLSDPAKAATIVPAVWSTAGKVSSLRTYRTPKQGTMRVVFDLDAGGQALVELRVVLQQDAHSMSETWLYRWTQ
jgi:periplasmic glucans biosynthesis protein